MPGIDFEAEYNNRARVPDHAGIFAAWARDAAAYRAQKSHGADIAYGASARMMFDFFPAERVPAGPVALFIHGGYWQAFDKSFFSHMAKGPNARGFDVAVTSYDLCPDVTVAAIVDQLRAAAIALWQQARRRIVAYGHSAGGHAVAMLLATDWPALDATAPADLVIAGLAVSGLFELAPLTGTSINVKLGLDAAEARRLSPVNLRPNPGTRLEAVVGGAESAEYLRQSRLIVETWAGQGCLTRYGELAGANHFTAIAGLAEPDSDLSNALVALAGA